MKALLFFIQQLKSYRLALCIGLLLTTLLACSSIALLSLSGWFIASSAFAGLTLTSAAAFNYFLPAAVIRFLALTRILSRYADRIVNHDFTFRILSTLRVWFYEKIMPLSPATLLSHRSGDLLNHITHDIDTLDHVYLNVLSPFLIAGLLTITVPIFIAYFSISLAKITVIALLCTLSIMLCLTRYHSQRIGDTLQHTIAQLRIAIIDAIQNYIDLLLFVKKENRMTPIMTANTQWVRAQKQFAQHKGLIIALMSFLSGLTVFLLLYVGIPLVAQQKLNGAQWAMIILLVIATFEQLTPLPLSCLSLSKSRAAANRLWSITQEKPAVTFTQDAMIDDHTITLDHIAFRYPDNIISVLTDFHLTIPMRAHYAITGYSGTGKTTLLQLIARVWDPQLGTICIGNQDIRSLSEATLRKTVALVTQHVHIFNASIKDNLTLMNAAISDADCLAMLDRMDLLKTVNNLTAGLHTEMGEFGQHFSGGEIRRISIARALLHNTPILLLDEPSTGLDAALCDRIWDNCADLFAQKTVLVATHDEKLIAKMTDGCVSV